MRKLIVLLLLVLQSLCISGTEASNMLTHETKQCLRVIKTIKHKYLNILKGQVPHQTKIYKNAETEEPTSLDHSGILPSLDSLLDYNWVWDTSPDNVEDITKISLSTIDGLARTGIFMLEKCVAIDANKLIEGFACKRAGNKVFISFCDILNQFKKFRKAKQESTKIIDLYHRKFIVDIYNAMDEVDIVKTKCKIYLESLEKHNLQNKVF